jgi:hypothetical protein
VGAGTVLRMLYPTPRYDRWDPWIVLFVLLVGLAAATALTM